MREATREAPEIRTGLLFLSRSRGEHHEAVHQPGRAYVYHGSGSGLSETADWPVEGDQQSVALGIVSGAGDVNGDGIDDLAVGAEFYDNPQKDEGAAFVYHGAP